MLAALLCNLGGGTPPPPPPPDAQPFFGGGPFKRRRYRIDEEELPEEQAEIVEEAILKAVEAIREDPRPKPIVLDAKRIYQRVYREVLGIDRERAAQMWREELNERLKQEDEELIVCLMLSL